MSNGDPPPTPAPPLDALADAAVALAADLLTAARSRRRRGGLVASVAVGEAERRFVVGVADEVLRIRDPSAALGRFRRLVAETGVPRLAGPGGALAIRAGVTVGRLRPPLTMSLLRRRLRRLLAPVVTDAADAPLGRRLASRRSGPLRSNLNLLGEAVLGDREAERRLEAVCRLIRRDDVVHVSVKLSGLCPRLAPLAAERRVEVYAERLGRLLQVAASTDPVTSVTLDMERYDEMGPTVEALRRTLGDPGLRACRVGLALQAYLPETLSVASEVCTWAARHRERGGAPVRVRLVKGANLSMERTEAELRGWIPAPFDDKADVDANYKRVLALLLDPAWGDAVEVGAASHNLFDVAWALTLADHLGVADRLHIEMLEGMAEAEALAVAERAGPVLLYTPVVEDAHFDSAVAYLARRLEEVSQPGNYLAAAPMVVGDHRWALQERRFRAAVASLASVSTAPRRAQDRRRGEPWSAPAGAFRATPDTDFSQPANRAWVAGHVSAGGQPGPEVVTDPGMLDRRLARWRRGRADWASASADRRREVLHAAAEHLEARRGELVAAMVHEAAKVVSEADAEVSEAVDLARCYATGIGPVEALKGEGMRFDPHGCVLVAGPWNFPVSIPAGGALAALAVGSSVLVKPSPRTAACAALVVEALHGAGVPADALQLAAVPDGPVGRHLVTHPDVDAVSLTGSLDTARRFLQWRPRLVLHAETSGKNAVVVTGAADLDQAVADLVHSAFGHAGQKCSAASLAICLPAVHDDPRFRAQLADATASLRVGPAGDPATEVPDLIGAPDGTLLRALTRLEPGEEWLVQPRCLDGYGRRWTPGVRLGVGPGSFLHMTECFGPVLGVMRAPDLPTALAWQNATAYGLTGGIHSLDVDELRWWCDRVEVGNAYVNRPITGAVVGRQPFGGWKCSSVGATVKVGGPNTLLTMGRWRRADGRLDVHRAAHSFDRWWDREFGLDHDPAGLTCEANVLRYLPLPLVVVRVSEAVSEDAVRVAVGAATVVGTPVEVSLDAPRPSLRRALPSGVPVRVEDDAELVVALSERAAVGPPRLRLLGELPDPCRRELHGAGVVLDDHPVLDHGRLELLHWLREQTLSVSLHRHGIVQERFRACLG